MRVRSIMLLGGHVIVVMFGAWSFPAHAGDIWITSWTLPMKLDRGVRATFLPDARWQVDLGSGKPIYLEDREILTLSDVPPTTTQAVAASPIPGVRKQVRGTDRPDSDDETSDPQQQTP